MRMYLYDVQGGKCHYCQVQMTQKPVGKYFCTSDHIIPKARGGPDSVTNFVGACHTCNNMRGTIPYEYFKKYIEMHGNKQTIKSVLRKLTREQYLSHQAMYDAVRLNNFAGHIPFEKRTGLPPMFGRTPIIGEPPPPAPTYNLPKRRRDFIHLTRRKLQSIIIGIPYRVQKHYWETYLQQEGLDHDGRYLGGSAG